MKKIPLRSFYCELKHRPEGDDGSNEELIQVLELKVPRLKNSEMEKQWAIASLWNKLFAEYQDRGINQIFIFTHEFGELLMRMEVQPFDDEPAQQIKPPDEHKWKQWQSEVEKRFFSLYRCSISRWSETF
jgi:hypothetical protein